MFERGGVFGLTVADGAEVADIERQPPPRLPRRGRRREKKEKQQRK
jgi:hypothetical protein